MLFVCAAGVTLNIGVAQAQSVDSVARKVFSFPGRLFSRVQSGTARLNQQLTSQTEKYLQKMEAQEQRIQKRLSVIDPAAAQRLFAGSAQQYSAYLQKIKTDTGGARQSYSGVYLPYLDSLQGSMAFLKQNPQLLANAGSGRLAQVQGASGQLQTYEGKLMVADQAKAFISQRQQLIGQYITQHANVQSLLNKPYADMNKQVYYYSQQLRQYKEQWEEDRRSHHSMQRATLSAGSHCSCRHSNF